MIGPQVVANDRGEVVVGVEGSPDLLDRTGLACPGLRPDRQEDLRTRLIRQEQVAQGTLTRPAPLGL